MVCVRTLNYMATGGDIQDLRRSRAAVNLGTVTWFIRQIIALLGSFTASEIALSLDFFWLQ